MTQDLVARSYLVCESVCVFVTAIQPRAKGCPQSVVASTNRVHLQLGAESRDCECHRCMLET